MVVFSLMCGYISHSCDIFAPPRAFGVAAFPGELYHLRRRRPASVMTL
jgi:hypothetical protein